MTRSADWRVSAVPELRSILLAEKAEVPARTMRIADVSTNPDKLAVRAEALAKAAYERSLATTLGIGEMYWVSADMVGLALDAAGDVPGFNPATDLPAPHGFMVLEKPLPALRTWVLDTDYQKRDVDLEVDLITWSTVGKGIRIESFCRNERVPNSIDNGSFFEPVWFHTGDADGLYEFDDEAAVELTVQLMSFLAAAALLMASPGVADRSTLVPKTPAARKDAKRGRSGLVTVISLHAPKHVTTGDADESGRVYTHRWMVRGHWRNQPHGPNRSRRSVRWIPSYIKGPAGKPLRETERVWAWRR